MHQLQGYAIAILVEECLKQFENQSLTEHLAALQNIVRDWCQAVNVPMLVLIATKRDSSYWKPRTDSWEQIKQLVTQAHVDLDIAQSFFVSTDGKMIDSHATSDQEFAESCGLTFYNDRDIFGNPTRYEQSERFDSGYDDIVDDIDEIDAIA